MLPYFFSQKSITHLFQTYVCSNRTIMDKLLSIHRIHNRIKYVLRGGWDMSESSVPPYRSLFRVRNFENGMRYVNDH